MNSNYDLAEIRKLLVSCRDQVFIFSHPRPDGDSVGSTIGLYYLLREAGVQAVPVLPTPVPQMFEFLYRDIEFLSPPVDIKGKTAVVLDCSDLKRLGQTGQNLSQAAQIINIDHHLNNEMFGNYNYVDPQAAAVGQIIYSMFSDGSYPREAAQALYTALYTDTGRFSYSNTTATTLAVAAALVEWGASPQVVYNEIHQRKTREYYHLLAEVLGSMNLSCQGKVASITLRRDLLSRFAVEDWELDDLNDYPRSLNGVVVSIIFKEVEENSVRVSLRSKGLVNVATVAGDLGGGGHHNAAGINFDMPLALAQEKVMARVQEELPS